ncbi:hypothetical protein BB560_000286 [Smittium megazygosporum]|uniref:Dicer-like protein 1 n=1 Tax=Smittium megazygosporum TaxID=133381 RepID=A0A2T9ZKV7_9FUNG|nr:hypothetical protein BB560_000286 [Smittium megazygosporum]
MSSTEALEIDENAQVSYFENNQLSGLNISLVQGFFNEISSQKRSHLFTPDQFKVFSKDKVPRSYQIELFLRSIAQNTVIVLETGTGKTLIACMIIEYYGLKEQYENCFESQPNNSVGFQRKLTIFLCNTSVLVEQQGKEIKKSTSRTTYIYKSGKKHTKFSGSDWKNIFAEYEVHVMTHQIFLNCLRRGYITMDRVKLIIFDECHHSRKDSPYNLVMREFYDLLDEHLRPRIIGLTASIANATENLNVSINNIKNNLNSVLHTVSDNYELTVSKSNAQYNVLEYDIIKVDYSSWKGLKFFKIVKSIDSAALWNNHINFVLEELGPYSARILYAAVFAYLSANFRTNEASGHATFKNENILQNSIPSDETKYGFNQLSPGKIKKLTQLTESIADGLISESPIDDDGKEIITLNDIGKASSQDHSKNGLNDNEKKVFYIRKRCFYLKNIKEFISNKVFCLLEYLLTFKKIVEKSEKSTFRGIVFVNRQTTAYILSFILRTLKDFSFVKSEPFVGNHSGSRSDVVKILNTLYYSKKNSKKQKYEDIITRFSAGKINLLIATQVAEEGLDISSCNLVIRFDPALTLTNFIQARGRARSKDSVYTTMVPRNGNTSENDPYLSIYKGTLETSKSFQNSVDSGSHRTIEHYQSLVEKEEKLSSKIKDSKSDDLSQNTRESYSNETKVLKTELNCYPKELHIIPSLISQMKVMSSETLKEDEAKVLAHIATQIAIASQSDGIAELYFKTSIDGAQLTPQSAIQVLNDYLMATSKSGFNASKNVFLLTDSTPNNYSYTIQFPKFSVIEKVVGPSTSNLKFAKKAAAFFACICLYIYGALDKHLLVPTKKKIEPIRTVQQLSPNKESPELQSILKTENFKNSYLPYKFTSNSPLMTDYFREQSQTENKLASARKPSVLSQNMNSDEPFKANSLKRKTLEGLSNFRKHLEYDIVTSQKEEIMFKSFNPRNWDPPKLSYAHVSKNVSKTESIVQAFAYVINMNTFKVPDNAKLVPVDSSKDRKMQLFCFFSNPIPKNVVVPLYLEQKSVIPSYYKFDELNLSPLAFIDPNSSSYQKYKSAISSFPVDSERKNRVFFTFYKWKQLCDFSSSLFSLIVQHELRLDPERAAFAFALPSKSYGKSLSKIFSKRDKVDIESFSLDPYSIGNKLLDYWKFSELLPAPEFNDIDWEMISNFLYKPDRLTNHPESEWKEIMDKHFLISELDKYHICEYLWSIPNTSAGHTVLDILNGLKSTTLCGDVSIDTSSQTDDTLDETKKIDLEKLKTSLPSTGYIPIDFEYLIEEICEKAKKIRLLDFMYQNQLIYHDLDYLQLANHELLHTNRINYRFNFLNRNQKYCQRIHNRGDIVRTVISTHGSKKLLEKNQETADSRRFFEVVTQLRALVSIPSMSQIIPWTKDQFLKLTVLPSLFHRLHTLLIQNDLLDTLDFPFQIDSANYSLKSKHDINAPDSFMDQKNTLYNQYPLTSLDFETSQENRNKVESLQHLSKGRLNLLKNPNNMLDDDNQLNTSEKFWLKRFNNYSQFNITSNWLIRSALTSENTKEDVNYQRIEFLGDSIIKLIMVTQLYTGLLPPFSNESALSQYTVITVSNKFLSRLCRKLGLFYALSTQKIEKKNWFPPGLGWRRSNYPNPRTISYFETPWNFLRGCPNAIDDSSDFIDRFNHQVCKCPVIPLDQEATIVNGANNIASGAKISNPGVCSSALLDSNNSLSAQSTETRVNQPNHASKGNNAPSIETERGEVSISLRDLLLHANMDDSLVNYSPGGTSKNKNSAMESSSNNLKKNEIIPPLPIYVFFPSKKPKERTKPKAPFHKQHFASLLPRPKYIDVPLKSQADLVESLLGASFKFGGVSYAFQAAKSLGLVHKGWNTWNDMNSHYNNAIGYNPLSLSRPGHASYNNFSQNKLIYNSQDKLKNTVSYVENIIGYKFKDTSLCLAAFTHSSITKNRTNNYERLEFLGDTVIGVAATIYYFDNLETDRPLNLHLMTLLKHVAVSNEVLGLLCHLYGFIRYIRIDDMSLKGEFEMYQQKIKSAIENANLNENQLGNSGNASSILNLDHLLNSSNTSKKKSKSVSNAVPDIRISSKKDSNNTGSERKDTDSEELSVYWQNVPQELWRKAEPPKSVADVLEALVGAVYVDTGFDFDATLKVVDRIFVSFLRKFIGPGLITLNPIIHILLLIQSKGCSNFKYVIQPVKFISNDKNTMNLIQKYNTNQQDILEQDVDDPENIIELEKLDPKTYVCFFIVHNNIAAYGYGENARQAKLQASENGISNWESDSSCSLSNLLENECNCTSKRDVDIVAAYKSLSKEHKI